MKAPRSRKKRRLPYLLVVGLVVAYVVWATLRPLPNLQPATPNAQLQLHTTSGHVAWPSSSQAAVGVVQTDILEVNGNQVPVPIASTAKIITVLTVLEKKPLQLGQDGPTLTLTDQDVALYNNYVAQDGSVVPVQAGEQLSERQALEAIMLPSANNMADSLAIWAFGSLGAYSQAANDYLARHGLTATHVGSDASGLSPTTTSTAHDLVLLGKLALANPVLTAIAGQPSATDIPVAGTVDNVNILLGSNGIIGLKTGNSDQAGGVFVAAAKAAVNGKTPVVITAVVGAPDLSSAMRDSVTLVRSAQNNFQTVNVIRAGAIVGRYRQPWSGSLAATVAQDLNVTTWAGSTITTSVSLKPHSPTATSGQIVGSLRTAPSVFMDPTSVPVKIQSATSSPSILWRLAHPY